MIANTNIRQCDGLTGSAGKSQIEDQQDQIRVKQLGPPWPYKDLKGLISAVRLPKALKGLLRP